MDVVHKDEDVVAVDKPAGVPVIPARGEPAQASLHRRIEAALGERLWIVHRLDRDTSGLVVFARHAEAHRALSMAFEHRRVEKQYVAFVAGDLPADAGRIEAALHEARRGKARPARPGEPGAREATTIYDVRRCWRREALVVCRVEARPLTGRHHQIRVHLRSVGAPILFDRIYGRGVPTAAFADAPCQRLALHARRLVLPAPRGEGALALEAPLPADLRALEAWLDAGWRAEAAAGGAP